MLERAACNAIIWLMCVAMSVIDTTVLQIEGVYSYSPPSWSPCSTVFSLYLNYDEDDTHRLMVFNLDLEVVFAWPDAARRGADISARRIVPAWLPCSSLIAISQPKGRKNTLPAQLEACWHPFEPGKDDLQAVHETIERIQDIGPTERLVSLVQGVHGLAVITASQSPGSQSSGTLYLWLADGVRASLALQGTIPLHHGPQLEWSPAGNSL